MITSFELNQSSLVTEKKKYRWIAYFTNNKYRIGFGRNEYEAILNLKKFD